MPQVEPLTEQQLVSVCKLRHSCQQAEDALSQGMEKLEQTLAQCVAHDNIGGGSYGSRMASAMERLDSLECFMNQVTITSYPKFYLQVYINASIFIDSS